MVVIIIILYNIIIIVSRSCRTDQTENPAKLMYTDCIIILYSLPAGKL